MNSETRTIVPGATRSALEDLVHRYARAMDVKDFTGVGELFLDDGVLVTPRPPESFSPTVVTMGRDGISAAVSALAHVPLTQHAVVGVTFEAGAGEHDATGRVVCRAAHLTVDGNGAASCSVWNIRYLDSYRFIANKWFLARREVHLDWIEEPRVMLHAIR
ncbi:nuclear transport factor 2 family protein [Streptosporangium sp. NPDC051022]|uniref:nuclear transport factor 2 family protein n=1 Tax=Streptosporangium sp. NPDC051022 TaxID=3155752 RepID=UPI003421CD65